MPVWGEAREISLHRSPLQTKVKTNFYIGGTVFLLPAGEWVLIATRESRGKSHGRGADPRFGTVVLADIRDGVLVRSMLASSSLDTADGTWTDEPCRRDDTLYKVDRSSGLQQFCALLNHRVNAQANAPEWLRAAWIELDRQHIKVPEPFFGVYIWRFGPGSHFVHVEYLFNPEVDGIAPSRSADWRSNGWHRNVIHSDPQKVKYAFELRQWTDAIMPLIERSFRRRLALDTAVPATPFPRLRERQVAK